MKVIDDIIGKKDKCSFVHIVIITISILVAVHLESKTGIKSIWWYLGAIAISVIIIMIQIALTNRKIRLSVTDKIYEENYEIASMLVDKKLVTPSTIKPLLDEIQEMK